MKTLIVILVLFCSISAKAEKLEGLFGVKIGEILTKELIIHPPPSIGFNYDVFLNHKADELFEYIKVVDTYKYEIEPTIPNSMFFKYKVTITPISKKIIAIEAITRDLEHTVCLHLEKSTYDFFIKKYRSDYELKENLHFRILNFIPIGGTEDIGTKVLISCDNENSFYQLSINLNNYGQSIGQEIEDEIEFIKNKLRARIEELAKLKLDTSGF